MRFRPTWFAAVTVVVGLGVAFASESAVAHDDDKTAREASATFGELAPKEPETDGNSKSSEATNLGESPPSDVDDLPPVEPDAADPRNPNTVDVDAEVPSLPQSPTLEIERDATAIPPPPSRPNALSPLPKEDDEAPTWDWRSNSVETALYFGGLAAVGAVVGVAGYGLAFGAERASSFLGSFGAGFLKPVFVVAALSGLAWGPIAAVSFVLALGGAHKWPQAIGVALSSLAATFALGACSWLGCGGLTLICTIIPYGPFLLLGLAVPTILFCMTATPVVGAVGGEFIGSTFFPNEVPPRPSSVRSASALRTRLKPPESMAY